MNETDTFLPRHLVPELEDAIASARVVNLIGPRQVGKTTLVRDLFGQGRFITLDDAAILAAINADPEGQLASLMEDLKQAPLIIDEAQNLTPKQMKTLITRAGPGTKMVCLGNVAQIDTPYLTETSSGITYVVDHFKNWKYGGHMKLHRGERSRLADFASDNL